ncbi:MAG TPA: hypothetical protein VKJ77_26220 [Caballeronia sp.]|nr:hypothetical protein [Caballeronia sp.]
MLKSVVTAVRGTLDRKTLGGVLIGAAIMVSVVATAQTSSSGNWFSSLFPLSSTGTGNSALISQQESVVATALNSEATDCANGADGTVGAAILAAQNVHQQIASATPAVESLFSPTNSCFIGQLADLSPAIPSLASILSAVESAVAAYAQKKVCTAVNNVTGMVTTPINQAITSANSSLNVNNILNKEIGGQMKTIDPALGAQYHPTVPDGTYTINTNPFNAAQTSFNTSTNSSGSTTTPMTNIFPTTTPAAAPASTPAATSSSTTSTSWWSSVSNVFH